MTGDDENFTEVSLPFTNNNLSSIPDTISTIILYLGDQSAIDNDLVSNVLIDNISFGDFVSTNEVEEVVFKLGPNPVSTFLDLDSEEKTKYEVYDVFGNLILKQDELKFHHNINLSRLNQGHYFIKIVNENGKTETEKILKL